MSNQRPEQGVLRLASDRSSRKEGAVARTLSEGEVSETENASLPVADDLPVFEEDSAVANPPERVARTILDERSLPGEQLRLLAARLRAMGLDRRLRRIGVVSSALGEGKTTVSLGLCRALALERQRRVLLIEVDMRRPAIDNALGLEPPALGLREYLEGAGDVPTLRRMTTGFWVLSAGRGVMERPEILSTGRLSGLLRAADRVFDYVVLDFPPLLPVADAVVVQDHVDGFVFVVRSRHSPRETIQKAAALLKPGSIAGVVLNGQHDILPSYGQYAYRRYGKQQ
jgi:capsular exopolysaccharide synthesis family protein